MSLSRQRAGDLVSIYDQSLEQQIVGQGSSLACGDEDLWRQVEALLKDGEAQETHCLGVDPLRVMEESLTAAPAGGAARLRARAGLKGLAKAFEVLEQAALNLYLGHWRAEYKVVKMYSGLFTHYIRPVLSLPQIEELFGLLGYQPSPRAEQLRLARVSAASLDRLLALSCAFFLARCECRLLLAALGRHAGEAQWELGVVRERQRGHSLQVALDNTKKTLDVNQPFDGEGEIDLYTDEYVKGGRRETVLIDDESPRSLTWVTQSSASPPAVKTHSNGVVSLSATATSLSAREQVCISTLNCQLSKTSPLEADPPRSSSACGRQGRRPCREPRFDRVDSQSRSLQLDMSGHRHSEAEVDHSCLCLQSAHLCPQVCTECNALHDIDCTKLELCFRMKHRVEELRASSPQGQSLRVSDMSASLTLSSNAAMSSLALRDEHKSISQPLHRITYHDCCDMAKPDPQFLCLSCSVFHSGSCKGIEYCRRDHDLRPLGLCSCGRTCFRKPLVLCRYCGNEYCSDCWYRNPVTCDCGQTFDQSSSV
ncbi:spermatogenesis-associated protein 2-like protein [Trematomus bernacchii]|uniref:spermatogenesis-associated protein 2-like protein n=1 Tax=Trematomus bernacchii TaxID=40690 RepID=UPI00146EFC8F|nr:spermatogenesis-associated protein 2-like protein [Trematomus bernacchii]